MIVWFAHPKGLCGGRVDFFFRLDSSRWTSPISRYAGIARQAELIAAGEVTSRELVDIYLERIERFNPQLNAFRVVFAERARLEADQADARRGAGGEASQRPLLGVPIAVKDEQEVAGEVTTCGTNAYGDPARADSEIVRRMRAAGAVVIGKTQMPELRCLPLDRVPNMGYDAQPVGAGAQPRRLERGQRGGGGRGLGGRRAGGRRRRVDPHSVVHIAACSG